MARKKTEDDILQKVFGPRLQIMEEAEKLLLECVEDIPFKNAVGGVMMVSFGAINSMLNNHHLNQESLESIITFIEEGCKESLQRIKENWRPS